MVHSTEQKQEVSLTPIVHVQMYLLRLFGFFLLSIMKPWPPPPPPYMALEYCTTMPGFISIVYVVDIVL